MGGRGAVAGQKRLDSPGALVPIQACESKPANLIPISGPANQAPSSVWLAPGKGNNETERRSVCAKGGKRENERN